MTLKLPNITHSTIAEALAAAQCNISDPKKNQKNPHFKSMYADLSACLDAVRGPLAAEGLALVQEATTADGLLSVETILLHASGERRFGRLSIPAPSKPQDVGSALTYLRRYSLSAAISIAPDDDDDGEAAQQGAAVEQSKRAAPSQRQVQRPTEAHGPPEPPDMRAEIRRRFVIEGVRSAEEASEALLALGGAAPSIDQLTDDEAREVLAKFDNMARSTTLKAFVAARSKR